MPLTLSAFHSPKVMALFFISHIFILFLVNYIQSLQIPDHQTHIGKLFYYKIPISSLNDIRHISVSEAGHDKTLPEWLYFNRDTNEIIGIPFTKELYFIRVMVEKYDSKELDDIFAIDITDIPDVPIKVNHIEANNCIIRIKETFRKNSDIWKIISYLTPTEINAYERNSHEFHKWLQTFSFTRNTNGDVSISIDEQKCGSNILSSQNDDEIHDKLKKLGLHAEIIHISRTQFNENNHYDEIEVSTQYYSQLNSGKRNHYRRHINDAIHATPILAPDWMTLTKSIILPSTTESHSTDGDPLSRVLIPSMTSPTVSLPNTATIAGFASIDIHKHIHEHIHTPGKYHTPVLYTTPVLSPERPTIIDAREDMLTPTLVISSSTVSTSSIVDTDTDTMFIAPSPSFIPEITTSHYETTEKPTEKLTEKPTERPTEKPTKPPEIEKVTTLPAINKSPYIHRRLRKLELIAGKYFKYTIPTETFVDFEDGDTRRLKLTFLMSLSSSSTQDQPSPDYWIQFDHENQYLYALPTEDDVGKHTFSLVAVDSNGAHVTETLEVHVRQNRLTRAFTHVFTLSHVSWDQFQFAFLIEAASSLMRRITTRIIGDSTIQTIAVLKIERHEKDNTWSISWTNDSLPTHPCPRGMIEEIYAKLHDPNKVQDDSFAEPSRLLKQTLSPEFRVQRVQLKFLPKSACGSYELPDFDDKSKVKVNPVVRNRIGRLGPYKLGEVFRYKVPEDTFFAPSRNVATRELSLTLRAIDPPHIPEFLFFDTNYQEFIGLAIHSQHVGTYELNLIAEDRINGGMTNDLFTLEIIDEPRDLSRQYTFEAIINLLAPHGKEQLNVKDKVDVVWFIASGMLHDGDTSAVKILSIRKHLYDRFDKTHHNSFIDTNPLENVINDDEDDEHRSHRHNHHLSDSSHRNARDAPNQYYFEFKWTNKTILSLENCPKELITSNIVHRIFKRDQHDPLKSLKDIFEPAYDLINVELIPIGVCKTQIDPLELGRRPTPITSPPPTIAAPPVWTTPKEDEDPGNAIDIDEESNDFLLTTIIPPVAILIALIFAAIVGCCFHRANKRRKSVEISSRIPDSGNAESEAFLQKGRIPVILEFEQQQQQQSHVSHQPQYNLVSPVIMPPVQQQSQHIPPQQMTPLRHLSKPTYQPLSQGSQMRRQPPPYYK